MNLEEFDIGINRVEYKNEKIYYIILVQYKDLKYEVNKRYSEFEELHCELLHFGFSALPNLPKKKLMSYKNSDYVNYRKKALNSYIQDLFIRPDIRCCASFLNFFMFYDKISLSIEIVKTKLLNSIGSQKFAMSDLCVNEKYNFIVCVYEDKSNLSKLGKLWSIIEPDMVGEIKVFTYNNDLSSTFVEKYKEQTIYKTKNVIYKEDKNEVIISGDDGKIHIYKIDVELFDLTYIKSISCHNDTILKMMQLNNSFFCTCGYDNAFRLFHLDDYKIISGGRCNKRLEKDKITTCHLLEYNNIVIGTDCSLFFIYNMSSNPPTYLDTKKLKNGGKISCFTNTNKYLFIGYDNIIACYSYHYSNDNKNSKNNPIKNDNTIMNNDKSFNININNNYSNHSYKHNTNSHNILNENITTTNNNIISKDTKNITKLVIDNNISAQYVPPLNYDNNVLSMCVNKDKKILYAGYEDAIIIWSITNGLIISSFHGHTNGVHCLKFLSSSEFLLSGGNGGNLKIWKSDIDNFRIWKPKRNNKIKDTRLTTREIYKTNYTDQNNFNFNESDNSDREYKSSINSETISIDNLLDQNNKKIEYEVFDTSNYKKNLINYNESRNVNILNSSRENMFCDNKKFESTDFKPSINNLDICYIDNDELDITQNKTSNFDKFNNLSKSYQNANHTYDSNNTVKYDNIPNNNTKYDHIKDPKLIYENKLNQNILYNNTPNQNISYDMSNQNISYENISNSNMKHDILSLKNVKYNNTSNLNTNNYSNISQNNNFDQYTLHEKSITRNIAYGADTIDLNYNRAPIEKSYNNSSKDKVNCINFNDITESDNSSILKKNIVCVSDEDEDLVTAFI